MKTNESLPEPLKTGLCIKTNTMKSYQMLNRPVATVAIMQVARVASELANLGFGIITAQFGDSPSITIKPCVLTQKFVSVCTGQANFNGRMCRSYAAVYGGVKLVWHKPLKPLH